MSYYTTFNSWDEMLDYLKKVDHPQCFMVNYLPDTQEYAMWIGNQPYYSYEKLIELEMEDKFKIKKQLDELREQMKDSEKAKNKQSEWSIGYKELKNYIHNDLGATKEQIHEMIQKAIKIEVKKAFKMLKSQL